ncbi:MAG: hypothetical protein MZV65_17690 [Chromatiales bacterium]|nr:hypothetical protein [Chromatiales bacterium]
MLNRLRHAFAHGIHPPEHKHTEDAEAQRTQSKSKLIFIFFASFAPLRSLRILPETITEARPC